MKHIIYCCSLLVIIFLSCEENMPGAKLGITVPEKEYHVGDTVTFYLNGTPDNIVFYSGEIGHNYELRDRLYADNDLFVDFTSYVRYGTPFDNMKCMVSSNFNGVYDVENVEKAEWTDVSSKFTFSDGADRVPSGRVNLKEYVKNDEDTLYFAFLYDDKKSNRQNNWIVRTINVEKVSPEGSVTQEATMSTIAWKAVDFKNLDKYWTITTAQVLIDGGANQPENEDWLISMGFHVRKSVPDTGITLKNISTTMTEYQYVYTQSGTFNATFATSSEWYSGRSSAVTSVPVVIKP